MNRLALPLVLAVALAGCAVTQPKPPTLDLPAPTATLEQQALLEHWWTVFDDPVLNRLVDEALAANLDLRSAMAKIDLARAQVLLAQSYLYPSGNLVAAARRSRITETGSQPLGGANPISNDYSVGVEAFYALDLWGKYRSGSLAAQNDLLAQRYAAETVRITVAADVAAAYFELRAADAELIVLENTLKSRTDTLQLQQDRFDGGLIGEYDLRQADAERLAAVADIARTRRSIGVYEAALATLVGRSPREVFNPVVARGRSIEDAINVPQLPAGLPSGLIERRPDVRQSEANLAAADLRIQEARAAYYPDLNITASFGTESASFAKLFTGPSVIWGLGASLLQPLFGLKAIEANVDATIARKENAVVNYQQTVQVAFREVHDALVANASARETLAAETQRRDQIAKALVVANLRYDAGRTGFLEVLDAQRTLLAAETLRIAAARNAKISIVDFARSLGGGWSPEAFAAAR
jgi:multidrug efflux system outer membrane protein